MTSIAGQTIAIVGGGPGGLTLARLLQLQGADVAVYERDRSRDARVQGSALDLHEHSGLAALDAAGLMDRFWASYRPDLDKLRITDAHGTILHDHPRTIQGAGKRPEIERGPLRDLLLDSLQPGTVHWNKKLESAAFGGNKVVLRFADGEQAMAGLVVGADGANSRLRALLTPVRPEYVGVSLVEGLVPAAQQAVPELWRLLEGAALMALGGQRTFGMGTKPDGSILFYAGLTVAEAEGRQALESAQTPEQRTSWFRTHFPGWSTMWEPLFAQAESLVWRPLLCCPAGQQWLPNAHATLIGDAAHVMPPYAGEGVNMAMLDALVLSRQFAACSTTREAIAAYETEMFARMRDMTADTMRNTEMFYAPDAAEQIVRLFRSFGNPVNTDVNANTAEWELTAVDG